MVRQRVGTAAVVVFLLGLLLYGAMTYRVVMAGGFATSSVRSDCALAATGVAKGSYRAEESIDIVRSYLPPSAVCVWSGGSRAALVPGSLLSWGGPVLLLVGLLGGLGVRLVDRRRSRRLRRR